MSMRGLKAAVPAALVAALLAGCASSSHSSSQRTSAPAVSSSGAASSVSGPIAAAQTTFTKYSAMPAPATLAPLPSAPPQGLSVISIGTPSPALEPLVQGVKDAAAVLKWKADAITASATSPAALGSALQSAIQRKPKVIMLFSAFPLSLFDRELKQAKADGIYVISFGGYDYPIGGSSPVQANANGQGVTALNGKLLVDTLVSLAGHAPNAVFVNDFAVPIWFSITKAYKQEMAAVGGRYHQLAVNLADTGTKIPQEIVSYLQAHPDTQYVVLSLDAFSTGLYQALAAAGLSNKVKVISQAGTGPAIDQIRSGQLTATVAIETAYESWRMMYAATRLVTGADMSCNECTELGQSQLIVTKNNLSLVKGNINNFPFDTSPYLTAWHLG